jgi:hypothetical protein
MNEPPHDLTRARMLHDFDAILRYCDTFIADETPMAAETRRLTRILVSNWVANLRDPLIWRRKVAKIRDEYWPVRDWIVRPEGE